MNCKVTSVTIINYGVGNLHSVRKGLEKTGATVEILHEPAGLKKSDAIVLPGVGAFAEAKKNLAQLEGMIIDAVKKRKPLLGICLGLQLLFSTSHEGGFTKGLDLLKGEVVKLPTTVKLPQMGWNTINIEKHSTILEGIRENSYMYFAHSYFAKPDNQNDVVASTQYGLKFPSIFEKENVFATQFHPEKSGEAGLAILRNFVKAIRK